MATVYLTPADHGRPITLEEFEHALGQEGYRYELIGGKVEVSPTPNFPHALTVEWLQRLLDRYARRHGEVINYVSSHPRVFVPGEAPVTAPEPDVAAYRGVPLDEAPETIRWQDLKPVLVAEILSADAVDKDTVRNVELYLRVPSVREYWIIDGRVNARCPSMTVYRRRGRQWQRPIAVAAGDTYSTRLLPDFTLRLTPR
jgi:Uma2 family endonuclease